MKTSNRIIKFRVWDKNRKKMILDIDIWDDFWEENSLYKEHYVIMPFTGLTDRHGKGLYEGDIYKFPLPSWSDDDDNIGVVEWVDTGSGGGWVGKGLAFVKHGEIIGNIYETELHRNK